MDALRFLERDFERLGARAVEWATASSIAGRDAVVEAGEEMGELDASDEAEDGGDESVPAGPP